MARSWLQIVACAAAAVAGVRCQVPEPARPRAETVAIVDVAVLPMTSERVLRDHTVIVAGGVITRIGPRASVVVPPHAQRIDGRGRYLIPGLIDTHVHLRDVSELRSYLAYGVTSVIHQSGPVGNVPDLLRLRAQVLAGELTGPTVYATGRMLDGSPPIYPDTSVAIRTAEEAQNAVASQVQAGADFIKVYNNLAGAALRAAVAAAHERNVAVFGHLPRAEGRAVGLQTALEAGLDAISHSEEYFFTFFYGDIESQLDRGGVPVVDASRLSEAVRLTRAAGTAVTPNLSFVSMTRAQLDDLAGVLDDPEIRFLTPAVLEMWRQQNPTTRRDLDRFNRREKSKYPFLQKLTLALSRAGIPLLLGTDASAPGLFPGKAAHIELRELVAAGLTPYQALAAGTSTAGGFLSKHTRGDRVGTITEGSRADLILLRHNPLGDIALTADIDGVLVRGAWLTRTALEQMRSTGR